MKKGLELIEDINSCLLEKGRMAFWWLGQIGYVVKLGEKVLYIDAFLEDMPERNIPPLLKAEEIKNADFILGTHDHIDHIDRAVWYKLSLSSPKAKFVVPRLLVKNLSEELNIPEHRFIGLDEGVTFSTEELSITGIAAAHEFLDQDEETGFYPYLGYIVKGNCCCFYHSGDTCIYEGMLSKLKKHSSFDVMFLPINGRDAKRYGENIIGNMTYQEAVDLAGSIRPKLVVPAHYEMFSGNSIDPALFVDYLNIKYSGINSWVGHHGERVIV